MMNHILGIILFISVGIMFLKGKGTSFLIFNEEPNHLEKAQQLGKELGKFAAIICFIISIALIKNLFGEVSEIAFFIESSTAIMAITAFAIMLTLFKGSFNK